MARQRCVQCNTKHHSNMKQTIATHHPSEASFLQAPASAHKASAGGASAALLLLASPLSFFSCLNISRAPKHGLGIYLPVFQRAGSSEHPSSSLVAQPSFFPDFVAAASPFPRAPPFPLRGCKMGASQTQCACLRFKKQHRDARFVENVIQNQHIYQARQPSATGHIA